MPKPSYPSGLIPPSERFPKWMGEPDNELVYLGWGERNFAEDPIPVHRNPGWTYWLVTEGPVLVEFEDKMRLFPTNAGLLAGPECAFGFPTSGERSAEILAWIWKSRPAQFPKLPPVSFAELRFSSYQAQLLSQLHQQCRYENINPDEATPATMQHIRELIDITFSRAARQHRAPEDKELRLRIARQWMLDHLSAPRAIEDLARYLGTSTAGLHRLFRDQLGLSPGTHFRQLKMQRARELLARRHLPVKRVAYELGYRHPNDFSRAYRAHWGTPPSEA